MNAGILVTQKTTDDLTLGGKHEDADIGTGVNIPGLVHDDTAMS